MLLDSLSYDHHRSAADSISCFCKHIHRQFRDKILNLNTRKFSYIIKFQRKGTDCSIACTFVDKMIFKRAESAFSAPSPLRCHVIL